MSVGRPADAVVAAVGLLLLQQQRPLRPRLVLPRCFVETDSVALNVPVSNPCGWSLGCSMDLPSNPLTCSVIAPPRGEASKNGGQFVSPPNWQTQAKEL